ncbi:FAD-dependent monooxygenase [Nonomuraea sp. NPDC050202]|uniref:FAD-dependent oxidoreductase n=1 Tax=Nonomuraea sp. NPDC050202 TaxID=3155035 RepID=UPI003406A2D3
MNSYDSTICIVGAGPAGLITALGLARLGVPFVHLDQDDGPVAESRGLVVHAGALEVLDELGLAQELVAAGLHVPEFRITVAGHTAMRIPIHQVATPFPYILLVPQATTEALLYRRLTAVGHAPLARHHVNTIISSGDGHVVEGTDAAGTPFRVRARYLVGADGLRSTVRPALGIRFPQHTYDTAFLSADVQLDNGPSSAQAHIHPSRHGLLFMAPLSGDRWRLIISVPAPGGRRPTPPTLPQVQRYLDERGGQGVTVVCLDRAAGVLLHHGVADAFGAGRAILAGDAAHVHSPAGGMGMNTGIQDGYDAALTLAAIHRGADAATALAGYRERRLRAAREVVAFTDRIMRLVTLDDAGIHLLRSMALAGAGRLPFLRRRIAQAVSCVTRTPVRTGAPTLLT